MRTVLFQVLASMLLAGSALAQEVWKWTDENGVVHYSDQPGPGAVRVELNVQTYATPAKPTPAQAPTAGTTRSAPAVVYRSLEIWKPANDEAVINTGGQVSVRVRPDPAVAPGHSLYLYLDGKRMDGFPTTATEFELSEVPRGTHSLVAVIMGGGQQLIQSETVVFNVHQQSVAQPPVGPSLRPRP